MKICDYCGSAFETKNSQKKYCTKACKTKAAMRTWRITAKKKARDYLGNKCSICGYNKCDEALEFHHLDPSQKEFGICSDGRTRSWDRIKEELSKCILVCANCHREIHNKKI